MALIKSLSNASLKLRSAWPSGLRACPLTPNLQPHHDSGNATDERHLQAATTSCSVSNAFYTTSQERSAMP
jgi:hypothetical protein